MIKSCHPTHKPLSRHARQRIMPWVAFEVTASTIVIADVLRAKSFRHGNKLAWLLLAFVQLIGPWLYFAFGQERD